MYNLGHSCRHRRASLAFHQHRRTLPAFHQHRSTSYVLLVARWTLSSHVQKLSVHLQRFPDDISPSPTLCWHRWPLATPLCARRPPPCLFRRPATSDRAQNLLGVAFQARNSLGFHFEVFFSDLLLANRHFCLPQSLGLFFSGSLWPYWYFSVV